MRRNRPSYGTRTRGGRQVSKSRHLNAIHVTIDRKKTEPVTITWANKDDNTQSSKGTDCNCKQNNICAFCDKYAIQLRKALNEPSPSVQDEGLGATCERHTRQIRETSCRLLHCITQPWIRNCRQSFTVISWITGFQFNASKENTPYLLYIILFLTLTRLSDKCQAWWWTSTRCWRQYN